MTQVRVDPGSGSHSSMSKLLFHALHRHEGGMILNANIQGKAALWICNRNGLKCQAFKQFETNSQSKIKNRIRIQMNGPCTPLSEAECKIRCPLDWSGKILLTLFYSWHTLMLCVCFLLSHLSSRKGNVLLFSSGFIRHSFASLATENDQTLNLFISIVK